MSKYDQAVRMLEKIDPDHPMLEKIKRGDTVYNRIYLKNALEKYNLEDILIKEDAGDDIIADLEDSDDPVIKKKHAAMSSLYAKMSMTSNEFHVCKNDAQRKKVSIRIEKIMNSIKEIKQDLRYYYLHGDEKQEDEKYPIPADKVSALKKINSLRASISRCRKMIREEQSKEDLDNVKILKAENRIKEYEIHKAHIEKAYKNLY